MDQVYNFSAGPAVLPQTVLASAAAELQNHQGCGMSVMEISHRSSIFQQIMDTTEQDLRELLAIPDNYEVLFLQGGTSLQFAMIPMNFMKFRKAAYLFTGHWSSRAAAEAELFGEVITPASSADRNFSYIPNVSNLQLPAQTDYVYMCENNTIYGTKYQQIPETGGINLINDVSSCFLSEPMDISRYAMVYGGIQKNLGPAGMVIAIIRRDLISDEVLPGTPTMLRYHTHAKAHSLYNTPPTYNIYIVGKLIQWLKQLGGLKVVKQLNEQKAAVLYDFLDANDLFHGIAEKNSRSLMNVTFTTGTDELDRKFAAQAADAQLLNLKGHRKIGGLRASLYNAMPLAGVHQLVNFMDSFAAQNS